MSAPEAGYRFTNHWFEDHSRQAWDRLMPQLKPARVLEIGSFEGRSACYLIENAQRDELELHCIDTWAGGIEHGPGGMAPADMGEVEARFRHNIGVALASRSDRFQVVTHKGRSDDSMARLLAQGRRGYFDFVYVDGSHQAADVLSDAVLAFPLLRTGGVMGFDDYLWAEKLPGGKDPLRCPKPAIDAFVNTYFRKLDMLALSAYQTYVTKVSD